MKRTMLVYAFFAAAAAVLAAQEASKPSPYTGTSNPPPDTSIVTDVPAQTTDSKPPAGVTGYEQPAPTPASAQTYAQPGSQPPDQQTSSQPEQAAPAILQQPSPTGSSITATTNSVDGTDAGIVIVAPSTIQQPSLTQRDTATSDLDGDIVHPTGAPAGGVGYGATIRVRLLDTLSTARSQPGDSFRTRVASDVIQEGQILIPAGAEIDGTVVGVSSGRLGGHSSMHLRPETVILADGSRYRLYAQLSGAPGSSVRINEEGGVAPGSQLKKVGILYGSAVGGGAITGAILGGPGGALAGTLIGAGVITAHLLISHPQATLDSGTVLLFTLNQPLDLVPAAQSGN